MRHRPATPHPAQEAAFTHPDVVQIVTDLVAHPDLRLVKLAHTVSLLQDPSEEDVANIIPATLFMDADLGGVAQRVADSAAAIATASTWEDRRRRRGALLERLTHELVAQRLPTTTFHEHQVELTHNRRSRRSWTNKKEVVADGPCFEVYECKGDGLADIADIDELSDVATTANAEGTDPRPTIVVWGSEGSIRIQAKAWRLTETLYLITPDRMLGLAEDPPDHEIRPAP